MFKYIKGILSTISPGQRVLALSIILLSVTLISIGPKIVSMYRPDDDGLRKEVVTQRDRIRILLAENDTLSGKVIDQSEECTDEIFKQQIDFKQKMRMLEKELLSYDMEASHTTSSYHIIEHREEKVEITYDTVLNKRVYQTQTPAVRSLSVAPPRRKWMSGVRKIIPSISDTELTTINHTQIDTVVHPRYNTRRKVSVDTVVIPPKPTPSPTLIRVRALLKTFQSN